LVKTLLSLYLDNLTAV